MDLISCHDVIGTSEKEKSAIFFLKSYLSTYST